MVKCYNCEFEMIHGRDFPFEDYEYDGDGVISCFTCPKCGTYAEFVIPLSNSH